MSLKIDTRLIGGKFVAGRYLEVIVKADGHIIDLGLHSQKEVKDMLEVLKETVEDMESFLEE